jgi:hypothetical protein
MNSREMTDLLYTKSTILKRKSRDPTSTSVWNGKMQWSFWPSNFIEWWIHRIEQPSISKTPWELDWYIRRSTLDRPALLAEQWIHQTLDYHLENSLKSLYHHCAGEKSFWVLISVNRAFLFPPNAFREGPCQWFRSTFWHRAFKRTLKSPIRQDRYMNAIARHRKRWMSKEFDGKSLCRSWLFANIAIDRWLAGARNECVQWNDILCRMLVVRNSE